VKFSQLAINEINTNRQVQHVGEVLKGLALLYIVLLFLYGSYKK